MKEQNYKNHRRYLLGYHGVTFILVLILFISSAYSLYISIKKQFDLRFAIMFFITSVIFLFQFFYARSFSLKAQDRAIRAEESLRYFILTGSRIDDRIKMAQILSLRFAPDDEFVELAKKTAEENTSPVNIKKAIESWRADHYRI